MEVDRRGGAIDLKVMQSPQGNIRDETSRKNLFLPHNFFPFPAAARLGPAGTSAPGMFNKQYP